MIMHFKGMKYSFFNVGVILVLVVGLMKVNTATVLVGLQAILTAGY